MGASLVNTLAFLAVLLIGDSDGGLSCVEEIRQGSCVGYESAAGVAESDIHDSKRNCLDFVAAWSGVFSHSQQIVECDVGEVSNCGVGWVMGVGREGG